MPAFQGFVVPTGPLATVPLMVPTDWPRYWAEHEWLPAACVIGTVTLFRLGTRPFAAIDYAIHFHGRSSASDGAL